MADKLSNTLSDHIGSLSSLTTTSKTDVVSAVNEVNGRIGTLNIPTTGDTGTDVTNIQVSWTSTLGWHLQITTSNGTKRYIKFDQ